MSGRRRAEQSRYKDRRAADLIYELRRHRGLSSRELSAEIDTLVAAGRLKAPVSVRTIYRIEATGAIPSIGVQFSLAIALGLNSPAQVWGRAPVPEAYWTEIPVAA